MNTSQGLSGENVEKNQCVGSIFGNQFHILLMTNHFQIYQQRFNIGQNILSALSPGMVIVKKRPQPPMQPLHNGSYRWKHQFGIATTFIVPLCEIQQALHLLQLMHMPDSIYWYLCITIDLNAIN